MKRALFLLLAFGIFVGLAIAIPCMRWLNDREPEWTAASPAALVELEKGLEAYAKRYQNDAVNHLDRALELEPDLLVAKLFLLYNLPHQATARRDRLENDLETADLDALNARERFLIEHWRLREDPEARSARVEAFLAAHPEDPYGMEVACSNLWDRQELEAADACFQRLIKTHPNWVSAQNSLGYLAMALGRFSESEERFLAYRYIAPEQANPHDSLGELLMLLGRYDEAETALRRAIEVKRDFCASYVHLADLYAMSRRFDEGFAVLAEVEQVDGCQESIRPGWACQTRAYVTYLSGDPDAAWRIFGDGCLEASKGWSLLGDRLAHLGGHHEAAASLDAAWRERLDKVKERDLDGERRYIRGVDAHIDGTRRLLAGDLDGAVERFRAADQDVVFWTSGASSLKLFNRLNLWYALRLAGEETKAEILARKISAINPRLVGEMRLPELEERLAGGS